MEPKRVRADRAGPPGAESGHHRGRIRDGAGDADQSADRGQQQSFNEEQTLNPCRRVTDRAEQADLARALFDAEPEEQHRQQQRRDDEEETEIGEVLAEVGGASRRGHAFTRHVLHGQAHRQRIDERPEASGIAVERVRR